MHARRPELFADRACRGSLSEEQCRSRAGHFHGARIACTSLAIALILCLLITTAEVPAEAVVGMTDSAAGGTQVVMASQLYITASRNGKASFIALHICRQRSKVDLNTPLVPALDLPSSSGSSCTQ